RGGARHAGGGGREGSGGRGQGRVGHAARYSGPRRPVIGRYTAGTRPRVIPLGGIRDSAGAEVVIGPVEHRPPPDPAVPRLEHPVPLIGEIEELGGDVAHLERREGLEPL